MCERQGRMLQVLHCLRFGLKIIVKNLGHYGTKITKKNNEQKHKIAAESEHTSHEVNPVGARRVSVPGGTITINGAAPALYL